MSYALVEDVAASWESYEGFAADLERSLPEGLILHAAGRTDEGVRIIEVWESEDAWNRFAADPRRAHETLFATAQRYVRDVRPARLLLGRNSHESKAAGSTNGST